MIHRRSYGSNASPAAGASDVTGAWPAQGGVSCDLLTFTDGVLPAAAIGQPAYGQPAAAAPLADDLRQGNTDATGALAWLGATPARGEPAGVTVLDLAARAAQGARIGLTG